MDFSHRLVMVLFLCLSGIFLFIPEFIVNIVIKIYNADSLNKTNNLSCNGEKYNSNEKLKDVRNKLEPSNNAKQALSTKIVGSDGNNEAKHAVRIALISDYAKALCAGTMQNALYIITAAHCVHQVEAVQLIVTAGIKQYELEQNRSVSSFTLHEDFNPDTFDNDIALLRLNESLILSAGQVGPVEIGQPQLANGSILAAWITGWGLHDNAIYPNLTYPKFTQQMHVKLLDFETCKKLYQQIGKMVYENQICATANKKQGPCTGDDGAPLTVRYSFAPLKKIFVVGILSSFQKFGMEIPHIYTDLDKYKSWVTSKAGRQCDFNIHAYDFDNLQLADSSRQTNNYKSQARILDSVARTICAAHHIYIQQNHIQLPLKRPLGTQSVLFSANLEEESASCVSWQWKFCYRCQKFKSVSCKDGSLVVRNIESLLPTQRIIGGHDATPHQHPYQIRILRETDNIVDKVHCSGVIYNSLYILTSAECVHNVIPCRLTVIAGDHSVTHKEESEQIRKVVSILIHEKYAATTKRPNNIALLKIDIPFNFTTHVHSVLLAKKEYPSPNVQLFDLSGWGNVLGGNFPDVLQTIEIPLIDECECRLYYSYSTGNDINVNNICAGSFGKGMCGSDVGDPLTVTDNKTKYLVGITSLPRTCGIAPVIATKVIAYREWIALRAGIFYKSF